MCGRGRAGGCGGGGGWLFKGETSCFHKSCWTLRGLKGHMVQGGGGGGGVSHLVVWDPYGKPRQRPAPHSSAPECPAFCNTLCSGQQAEIETQEKAGKKECSYVSPTQGRGCFWVSLSFIIFPISWVTFSLLMVRFFYVCLDLKEERLLLVEVFDWVIHCIFLSL